MNGFAYELGTDKGTLDREEEEEEGAIEVMIGMHGLHNVQDMVFDHRNKKTDELSRPEKNTSSITLLDDASPSLTFTRPRWLPTSFPPSGSLNPRGGGTYTATSAALRCSDMSA